MGPSIGSSFFVSSLGVCHHKYNVHTQCTASVIIIMISWRKLNKNGYHGRNIMRTKATISELSYLNLSCCGLDFVITRDMRFDIAVLCQLFFFFFFLFSRFPNLSISNSYSINWKFCARKSIKKILFPELKPSTFTINLVHMNVFPLRFEEREKKRCFPPVHIFVDTIWNFNKPRASN